LEIGQRTIVDSKPRRHHEQPAGRSHFERRHFQQHQLTRRSSRLQYGDLPEFCDFDYIANVTQVNGAALWSLAEWEAAGYEVVWRLTNEPFWTHVPVGNTTGTTINLSKDNVIFGVRATDGHNHASPAVLPFP
jgi:hypothetical protein